MRSSHPQSRASAGCTATSTRDSGVIRVPVHFVYMVRCADGTLYTGYARDPHERENVHNAGRGAHYTACRRPVRLVYFEAFESRGDALRREYRLKRLTRPQKEALLV